MIAYVALGVLVVSAGLWLVRVIKEADPSELVRGLRQSGLIFGALISGAIFVVGVAGRRAPLAFLGACGLGAAGYGLWRGWSEPVAAAATGPVQLRPEIETRYIRMHVDRDGRALSGTVLRSPLCGCSLGELSRDQLAKLWRECRPEDEHGADLLAAYLDRFMPTWRQHPVREDTAPVVSQEPMTAEEAQAILGLGAGASESEIREVYQWLIEEGGSPHSAAELTEARDLLLKN
jgi:hypothetical protein